MDRAYTKITKFLGSRLFFWLIIAFFTLEALWIAFSFRYPMIFDESYHFNVIQVYASHVQPLISNQPSSLDQYGDLRHANSVLYHYLLSFPYRFIRLLTDSLTGQVIALRLINIAMATGGLVIFSVLFKKIKISSLHINIGLLIFTLLPITSHVAATINYDNLLFLTVPIYLALCIKIIRAKKAQWTDYAGLLSVGLFASMVKNTFLPIFAASLLYIAVISYGQRKKIFAQIARSFRQERRSKVILIASIIILLGGIFSARYIVDTIRYGTPHPSCAQTLNEQRCQARSVIVRNERALATRDQRPVVPLSDYSKIWLSNMHLGTTFTVANTTQNTSEYGRPLPILYAFIFFGGVIGVAILLLRWRYITPNGSWLFLVLMMGVLFLAVFAINVSSYYKLHAAYANQPRYIIGLVPILLVMIIVATSNMLKNKKIFKIGILVLSLLLLSQGGGATTHIIRSNDTWYWQNPTVIKANHAAQDVLRPLVKENYGKYGF